MADNTTLNAGTGGDVIASDDIAGVKHQRVKTEWGPDGTVNEVDDASGKRLPVNVAESALVGAVNETAPASDTASSGLNGRLQRVAQRITTLLGSLIVDDAPFTPGTTPVLMSGAEFDDSSPDSVDEGDAGSLRMSGRRELYTQLRDAAGNERGVNVTSANALKVDGSAVTQIMKPVEKNTYYFMIPSQVHVAGANTVHWDLFNADASLLVRVVDVRQIPNITTAVTGIVFDWKLARTTNVGTGGSAQTAWLPDLSQTALDADITCRSKPTGGASEGVILFNYSISSEETTAATIQIATQGGLQLIPAALIPPANFQGILLRQNQGLRCVQITNSSAGNTAWIIGFTVE